MKKAAAAATATAESEVSIQIAIRLPSKWIVKADDIAKRLSKEGMIVTRAMILRRAIALGLPVVEKKAQ